jgi:hypothetical protein
MIDDNALQADVQPPSPFAASANPASGLRIMASASEIG